MFTLLFLFAMFGLVSFPLAEQLTPALVASAANYVPQIVDQYMAMTVMQKRTISAALATAVAYPTVFVAASFVEFLFVPFGWLALLFSALAILPQTQSRASALLKQYVPCALRLLPPPPAAQEQGAVGAVGAVGPLTVAPAKSE